MWQGMQEQVSIGQPQENAQNFSIRIGSQVYNILSKIFGQLFTIEIFVANSWKKEIPKILFGKTDELVPCYKIKD